MTALIIISDGTVTVIIVDSMLHCNHAARAVAHLGFVACGGMGSAV